MNHDTRTKLGDNVKKASTVAGNTKGQGESRSSDGSASTNRRQRNFLSAVTNEKPGLSSGRNRHRTLTVHGSGPLPDCKRNQEEGVLGEDTKLLKNVYQIASLELVLSKGKKLLCI